MVITIIAQFHSATSRNNSLLHMLNLVYHAIILNIS